jgi:hypothetical protein
MDNLKDKDKLQQTITGNNNIGEETDKETTGGKGTEEEESKEA